MSHYKFLLSTHSILACFILVIPLFMCSQSHIPSLHTPLLSYFCSFIYSHILHSCHTFADLLLVTHSIPAYFTSITTTVLLFMCSYSHTVSLNIPLLSQVILICSQSVTSPLSHFYAFPPIHIFYPYIFHSCYILLMFICSLSNIPSLQVSLLPYFYSFPPIHIFHSCQSCIFLSCHTSDLPRL